MFGLHQKLGANMQAVLRQDCIVWPQHRLCWDFSAEGLLPPSDLWMLWPIKEIVRTQHKAAFFSPHVDSFMAQAQMFPMEHNAAIPQRKERSKLSHILPNFPNPKRHSNVGPEANLVGLLELRCRSFLRSM